MGRPAARGANQYRPDLEWSLSAYDLASNFTAAVTYELPFGKGRAFLQHAPRGVNGLITGWQVNTLVTVNGGSPVVLAAATNQTGLNTLGQRPNKAPGDPNIPNRTLSHWFNTALLSQPAAFTIGNAPRVLGNVRQPGNRNADISAMKNTYFGAGERYSVQLRVEAFDALNHPVFGGPNTNVNSAAFGTITSVVNTARVLQFGAKFYF